MTENLTMKYSILFINEKWTSAQKSYSRKSLCSLIFRRLCTAGQSAIGFGYVSFDNAGTFNGTDVLTYSNTRTAYKAHGWVDGTDADLGDSHQIGGTSARWYRFTLNQQGLVDLSVIQKTAGLDPAFTLYSGAFVTSAHDDTTTDPLNPTDSNFLPIQSVIDADPSGLYLKHSGYRDTVNQTYEGQFDAFGSWSMANDAGLHATVHYITAVSGTSDSDPGRGLTWGGNGNHDTAVGMGESLLQYYLPAGTYSVAIGGEACNNGLPSCTSAPLLRDLLIERTAGAAARRLLADGERSGEPGAAGTAKEANRHVMVRTTVGRLQSVIRSRVGDNRRTP